MLTKADPALQVVQLPTGVPGLDEVLGGGIPEYSCGLIGGPPGTGKTTLAHQILFANTSAGRCGVYISGNGQPNRKLLAQQQQFSFFDTERVNRSVHYVNLSACLSEPDPSFMVDVVSREVEDRNASIVVVDLARALMSDALWTQLALYLARCEATALLVGDYDRVETTMDAALSVADTVLFLRHAVDGSTTRRTIEALKVRGQQAMPGLHNVRLTSDGVQVFPRWPTPKFHAPWSGAQRRLATGIQEIDDMLEGGVPGGDTLLVEGPSGTGKSVLATHFIAQGGHDGDPGVVFLFEERPDRFIGRAEELGLGLEPLVRGGMVEVLSFRGRDMSSDEVIAKMQAAATRVGARRVVIDSATGMDLALGAGRGLQDCLWRLLDGLTTSGVTVWLNSTPDPRLPSLAPLVDDVLTLQRVEHETWFENRLGVAKMRWSEHTNRLLAYEIRVEGLKTSEPKAKPTKMGCLFDVPTVGKRAAVQEAEPLAAAS